MHMRQHLRNHGIVSCVFMSKNQFFYLFAFPIRLKSLVLIKTFYESSQDGPTKNPTPTRQFFWSPDTVQGIGASLRTLLFIVRRILYLAANETQVLDNNKLATKCVKTYFKMLCDQVGKVLPQLLDLTVCKIGRINWNYHLLTSRNMLT